MTKDIEKLKNFCKNYNEIKIKNILKNRPFINKCVYDDRLILYKICYSTFGEVDLVDNFSYKELDYIIKNDYKYLLIKIFNRYYFNKQCKCIYDHHFNFNKKELNRFKYIKKCYYIYHKNNNIDKIVCLYKIIPTDILNIILKYLPINNLCKYDCSLNIPKNKYISFSPFFRSCLLK